MQTINFTITPGILDRTVFTKHGPIVKRPQILAQGTDLTILSYNRVSIPSGFFDSSHEGNFIRIVSTPDARNDGDFFISEVLSSTDLVLSSSQFSRVDEGSTLLKLIDFTNSLRSAFNSHIGQNGVHHTDDTINEITSAPATDLSSAITLLSELIQKYNNHISLVGVHTIPDTENAVFSVEPTDLGSCIESLQELIYCYNNHRGQSKWHENRDTINKTDIGFRVDFGGPSAGPHTWQLWDPQFGQIADNTSDVRVYVNGTPVAVEAVYGLHRAIVLSAPWNDGDTVTVDYDWIEDPPIQFSELNNWGYTLNQSQNNSFGGFLDFPVKMHSHLLNPLNYSKSTLRSAFSAYKAGWKYKSYERAYLSAVNDPTLLLFNTPMNRVVNPAFSIKVGEQSISYDPIQTPSSPWVHTGAGQSQVSDGSLVITDTEFLPLPGKNTNFYSHHLELDYPSHIFSAWRFKATTLAFDGCFGGVGFGICDSTRIALVGCIKTDATNLSSACWMANELKSKFNSHILSSGVHSGNSSQVLSISDARDKYSLAVMLNNLKNAFNTHISDDSIHRVSDTIDLVSFADLDPDFGELQLSIDAVNLIRLKFNSHIQNTQFHYSPDTNNGVDQVKQIGILKSSVLESPSSWESFQLDWDIMSTVRLERDSSGTVSLFVSGEVSPRVSTLSENLPLTSEVDIELPLFESVFFGSVGDEPTSESYWDRIRVVNTPDLSHQFISSKSVSYSASTLPQFDTQNPWTPIGLSGSSWVNGGLVVDNTAYTSDSTLDDYGLSTGNYQGYIRVEPILNSDVTTIAEFTGHVQTWTYSIGNQALGLFINYKDLSIPFVFLQSDPKPGSCSGSINGPFNIVSGDTISISIDKGPDKLVSFSSSFTSATDVAEEINNQIGFDVAFVDSGKIRITSPSLGSESSVSIQNGSVIGKLGLLPGVYFGSDNDPEPRISYSGASFPDSDSPAWLKTGTGSASMLGRTLQITDMESDNFLCYILPDDKLIGPILSATSDWKLNFRVRSDSHVPASGSILSGSNLYFCGVVCSMEEGDGKTIDFHLSKSSSGTPYVSLYSFNSTTGALDSVAEYPFDWNDGQFHTYNVYTNKDTDLMIVLADNQLLGTFQYSILNPSNSGSGSIMFGSGSNDTSNGTLLDARSVSVWENVSLFRDLKISNPSSADQRYIGIWNGGDKSKLSSYASYKVDWSSDHTYRIVADPNNFVSVYMDGQPEPVISVAFNSLNLPVSSSTFLNRITNSRPCIAFGGFDPQQQSRSIWTSVSYTCKKRGNVEELVPPHQVLNYYNSISSPDHLFTDISHDHYGFRISSTGVPSDEFMSSRELIPYTTLLEGTPPVPATQNLQNRGGLVSEATPIGSASLASIFGSEGQLKSFSDDLDNEVPIPYTVADLTSEIIYLTNTLVDSYSTHLNDVVEHYIDDVANVVTAPIATDLASCCTRLNDMKSVFTDHMSAALHVSTDDVHPVTAPNATDYRSAAVLYIDLSENLKRHIHFGSLHKENDTNNYSFGPQMVDLASCITALNTLKSIYNDHRTYTLQHTATDSTNIVTAANATDFASAVTLALDIQSKYNAHRVSSFHYSPDGVNIITSAISSGANLKQLIDFTNDAKEKFGRHSVQLPQHAEKIVLGAGIWTIDMLTYCCSLLNELKNKFNSHKDTDSVHLTIVGAPSISAPDATDLASAIVLEADIRSIFLDHTSSGVYHKSPHFPTLSSSTVTTLSVLTERVDSLSQAYKDHIGRPGVHGDDDYYFIPYVTPVNISQVSDILNSVKDDYNLHRTRAKVHRVNDTSNPVTAPDAFDNNSAKNLANALRSTIRNHMKSAVFHNVAVTPDSIPENDGTFERLVLVTQSIVNVYNSHGQMEIAQTRVHGNEDLTNLSQIKSPSRVLVESLEELSKSFNEHVMSDSSHYLTDLSNRVYPNSVYSDSSVNLKSAIDGSAEFHEKYYRHIQQWAGEDKPSFVHKSVKPISPGSAPTDLHGALSFTFSAYSSYKDHMKQAEVHFLGKEIDLDSISVTDVLDHVVQYILEFVENLNSHTDSLEFHPKKMGNYSIDNGPMDENWVIRHVNGIKSYFNEHVSQTQFHAGDSSSSVISTPDATDIESASELFEEISVKFNNHRTMSGVHGNLCLIKISAPDRVLYNAMKFFIEESGQKELVYTLEEESEGLEFENTTTGSKTYHRI